MRRNNKKEETVYGFILMTPMFKVERDRRRGKKGKKQGCGCERVSWRGKVAGKKKGKKKKKGKVNKFGGIVGE